jgi:hypothetical protein
MNFFQRCNDLLCDGSNSASLPWRLTRLCARFPFRAYPFTTRRIVRDVRCPDRLRVSLLMYVDRLNVNSFAGRFYQHAPECVVPMAVWGNEASILSGILPRPMPCLLHYSKRHAKESSCRHQHQLFISGIGEPLRAITDEHLERFASLVGHHERRIAGNQACQRSNRSIQS